jgi:hypothetical protein
MSYSTYFDSFTLGVLKLKTHVYIGKAQCIRIICIRCVGRLSEIGHYSNPLLQY